MADIHISEKENRIKSAVLRVIPRRALLPVAVAWAVHFGAYYIPKLINRGRAHITLTMSPDRVIPFVPAFVVFYVLAFFQWVRYYLLLAREDKDIMHRYISAGIISKLMCMALFIALPTAMVRPEISGRGLFERCCAIVYAFDTPVNLFPSMHCLESWFCLRLALEENRRGRVPEIAKSLAEGYKGEMINCVNRKQWHEIREDLTEMTGRGKGSLRSRLRVRRKWQANKRIEAALDDAAEAAAAVGEVYVRSNTVLTCLLSGLVVASTVLIKQHYFADTVSGIAAAELSLLMTRGITRRHRGGHKEHTAP